MSSNSICIVIHASCIQRLGSFHHVVPVEMSFQTSFCAKSTNAVRRLAALGHTALDVVPLDVVGVVGLDIGGETVESALDGFLGGRVHHAGLETEQLVFAIVHG